MRMSALWVGRLAAALALAACTAGSADFVKQGATREEIRADNAACRAETDGQVGRTADISRDIYSGQSRGREDPAQLLRQTREARDEARYERIFAACMVARGYTRR